MWFGLFTGICFFQVSHGRRLIYWNGSVSTVGEVDQKTPLLYVRTGKEMSHFLCLRMMALWK